MSHEIALDIIGTIIMEDLRDKSINYLEKLIEGKWKSPSTQQLQIDLKQFNEDQLKIIKRALIASIDTGIHDFLFKIQEQDEEGFRITVNGQNIAEISDGLHGELFTEDGWYHRFSKYGEKQD